MIIPLGYNIGEVMKYIWLLFLMSCGTIEEKPAHFTKCIDVGDNTWICEQCYIDRTLNKYRKYCPQDKENEDKVDVVIKKLDKVLEKLDKK